MNLREEMARILAQRNTHQGAPPGFRRAAVLLPLYETETGLHLVLTKRTKKVPTHKGQISFPGGGFHEEDGDLQVTALRESEEEIGLRPVDVTIVGVLDDTATAASAHVVRPFLGFIPYPYEFRPDPFEIEKIIHLQLAPVIMGGRFREEVWERDGHPHSVFFYEHDGQTIWGLTARILKQFVEVVGAPLRQRGLLDPKA